MQTAWLQWSHIAPGVAFFGAGTGPIHYDDVACTGTEARLADCSHPGIGIENCFHGEDAGVVCDTTPCELSSVANLLSEEHPD